ncbi:hypothetical protein LZP85_01045 [Priestia flexa]|jgi:lipid-A-disaccharide synthase-like uncharacterized protein|uniref:Uncharacterized protein n=1 Tax=Priestia flexa TaxID=86664 RepID=A0A8I1SPY7_9BACI|nr:MULTISPECIES: hypothetical protein [Bacillaceae]KZB90354.1 hypothetical protein A2U94_16515 [Bacillus sp. VT 712]MBN8252876.1 hypothetical protein [Priestia flexa]MBN8435297.1 hypothetical protein [Priestia flexa]MCA0967789.1 hypothetical protein [Priestia flexa]MCA1202822.1 hypothetical protein [Priestia flexa]
MDIVLDFILGNLFIFIMILFLAFFISILIKKRVLILTFSIFTLISGLLLLIYAFNTITGFDLVDAQMKSVIVIGIGLLLILLSSIFIINQELKRRL